MKNTLCRAVSFGGHFSHLNALPASTASPTCTNMSLSLCGSAHGSSLSEGSVSLFFHSPFELPGPFNEQRNIGNKEVDSQIWSITTGNYKCTTKQEELESTST